MSSNPSDPTSGARSRDDEIEMLRSFSDVTGMPVDRSRFYLEAAGWSLPLAMASFYEENEEAEMGHIEEIDQEAPNNVNAQPPQHFNIPPDGHSHEHREKKKKEKKPQPPRSGIVTLGSYHRSGGDDDESDESEDEDEKGQAFYTGGSTTSGQQVLGPSKRKDAFIKDLFQKAKEHGARSEESGESSSSTSKKPSSFVGSGYKLGDASNNSNVNSSSSSSVISPNALSSSSGRVGEAEGEVTLRLWSSGFTVDDGPLRLYSDPANLEFLNSIKRGEIPNELVRSRPGTEVQLAMEDRRNHEYVPPKQKIAAFSGQGQMLGSPTPVVVVGGGGEVGGTKKEENEERARSEINLVESEPMTNIQFRLSDGSRLVARFNQNHTISQLYNFINTARPEYSGINYILTLFPNTELKEKEKTIKEANILNAALTQKIIK